MELEEIITSTDVQKEIEKATLHIDLNKKDSKQIEDTKAPNNGSGAISGGSKSNNSVNSGETKSNEKPSATPNLSAWFKAFGAPKKTKKAEEEELLSTDLNNKTNEKKNDAEQLESNDYNIDTPKPSTSNLSTLNSESNSLGLLMPSSPTDQPPGFMLPAPRARKASTGSTISERSSFSQDPDSPRIGIDERLGSAYPAPYPSPLGASPVMASPKDDIPKPTSPYPINGAIKVGFYQDTTTKSSPEKSCSPREQPSPYSNYAQHLYSSASATVAAAYGSTCAYNTPAVPENQPSAPLGFNNKNKTPSYYDQYKQPRSQDSDYNSSMSPNSNSPYQNSQQSPYQQQPDSSPYQSQNSPYQQPQNSPYSQPPQSGQQTSQSASPSSTSMNSPNFTPAHSPYQQQHSPYQQPNSPIASYQNPQQQQTAAFPQQSQQPQQQGPVQSTSGYIPPTATQQPTLQPKPPTQLQLQVPSNTSFQTDQTSPYSQNDSNSPYNHQASPLSPFNNTNSPKSQNTELPIANKQPSMTEINAGADWSNLPSTQANVTQPQQQITAPAETLHPQPQLPPNQANLNKQQQQVNATQDWVNLSHSHQGTQGNQQQHQAVPNMRSDDSNKGSNAGNDAIQHPMAQYNTIPAHIQSTNKQPILPNLHPPSAHGYMQTYSNPYLDRRINDTGASDQHHSELKNQSAPFLTNSSQLHQNQQHLSIPPQHKAAAPDEKAFDTSNLSDSRSLETPKPSSIQQQQMFDHLLGMGFNSKNLPFGRKQDTSKALEMFNRATMGFGTGFSGTPPPISAGMPKSSTEELTKLINSSYDRSQMQTTAANQSQIAKQMSELSYHNRQTTANASQHVKPDKPLNMVNATYSHQAPSNPSSATAVPAVSSTALSLTTPSSLSTMPSPLSIKPNYSNSPQSSLVAHQHQQQMLGVSYPPMLPSQPPNMGNVAMHQNPQKAACDLNLQRFVHQKNHHNLNILNIFIYFIAQVIFILDLIYNRSLYIIHLMQ